MLSKTLVTVTFNITCFSILYQSIQILGIHRYYILFTYVFTVFTMYFGVTAVEALYKLVL